MFDQFLNHINWPGSGDVKGCLMSELEEEILKELRRQSSLLEGLEQRQDEINGHLKVIGTLIVVAASALALVRIVF